MLAVTDGSLRGAMSRSGVFSSEEPVTPTSEARACMQ